MSNVLNEQVGGNHYKSLKKQPVELIVELNLDYFQGNIVKYVTRHRLKNGIEDIKKALHYNDLSKAFSKKISPMTTRFGFKTTAKYVDKYAEANCLPLLERNAIYYACINSYNNLKETLEKIIKEYETDL